MTAFIAAALVWALVTTFIIAALAVANRSPK